MKINLVTEKSKCCGCGVCKSVCPKKAIEMKEDEYGFVFPVIDYEKCIECGACIKNCQYHCKVKKNNNIENYAAAITAEDIFNSSSGGVFFALANLFIELGDVVVGVATQKENDLHVPRHVVVKNKQDLYSLQGSKYSQSDTNTIYEQTRELLINGTKVLFSGTPCQIAGLQTYLNCEYSNLYTVDIICHGIPSVKMYNEYLKCYASKKKGEILDFKFRDKQHGWGVNMCAHIKKRNGKVAKKIIPLEMSSYYSLFLKGDIIRNSCLQCQFASVNRVGDITLGDYWGITKEHPEFFEQKIFEFNKGVSCVLINSSKGKEIFDIIKDIIVFQSTEISRVAKHNKQLRGPIQTSKSRQKNLELFRDYGYNEVERLYWSEVGIKKYYYYVKNLFPRKWRLKIKELIGK